MDFWTRLKKAWKILWGNSTTKTGYELREIPLEKIVGNPYQPRTEIDEDKLQELALSIDQYGVITPIQLMPIEGDQYQLVAGERRVRASRSIDKETIPALIRHFSNDEMFEVSFLENLHREPMSMVDKAVMYNRLRTEFKNMSVEELAQLIGKSTHEITKREWILELPDVTKRALNRGIISEDNARRMMELQKSDQKELINYVARKEPDDVSFRRKIEEYKDEEEVEDSPDSSSTRSDTPPSEPDTLEDDLDIPTEIQNRG